jgi:hypothetical protein
MMTFVIKIECRGHNLGTIVTCKAKEVFFNQTRKPSLLVADCGGKEKKEIFSTEIISPHVNSFSTNYPMPQLALHLYLFHALWHTFQYVQAFDMAAQQ